MEFTERPDLKEIAKQFIKEGKQVRSADLYRSKNKWFAFLFLTENPTIENINLIDSKQQTL